MNKVDLFSGKGEQNNEKLEENKSHLDSKRPEQISVSKVISQNQKWRQCKIIGKNLSIRSYSAACSFDQKFYIYGGYQILNGMMSDFYSIQLQDSQQKFNWQTLETKGNKPGARSKHALIGAKSKIYLIGGLSDSMLSSNQIFSFDPTSNTWELLKPEGPSLPHIDSFGCTFVEDGGEQRIIIVCGYDDEKAKFLNSVYEYNITKNKVSILFEGTQEPKDDVPKPRSGCAATNNGKNVYMFGGKDAENRLNDTWCFSLSNYKYQKLAPAGHIPAERNGHSLEHFNGKLYVFGGIHDITWELDDLQIYHIDKNQWTTLEQDSPRKIEKKKSVDKSQQKDKSLEKKSPKKKNWYDTVNTLYNNKSSENSPLRKNYATSYKEEENMNSPGRMIDEQRKKAFLHRKNEMLKNFETSKEEKNQYIKLETSSQAMKNSLDVIGNPDPKVKIPEGRLTDFGKESTSKFLQPLSNDSNLIVGKKPCARDGHCSVVLGDDLIIFGGDRHQMSFNDIYKLNLVMAEKELGK